MAAPGPKPSTYPDKGLRPMPPATHDYNRPEQQPEGSKEEEAYDASEKGDD